jgi:hypothetical protein
MLSIQDAIFNELDRLEISTNQDPFSGLMTAEENSAPYSPDGNDVKVVKVYDDYASGFYHGQNLLNFLKGLTIGDVSLEGDSDKNIWEKLTEFEV